MRRGRTRIAPTPSGYLHLGNVVHCLVVERWADQLDLDIFLRIDDFDTTRVQERYIADIFRVLHALDITWIGGPRGIDDVSPTLNPDEVWDELAAAQERGLPTFHCHCTRRMLTQGIPCTCRTHPIAFQAGVTSVRCDARFETLPSEMDGAVLWRRDNLPGYHTASVILDRALGITHIMRGEDLRPASQLQRALAPYFLADNVGAAVIRHHPLIRDESGAKISKSAGAGAKPLALPPREELLALAADLLAGDR